MEVRLPLGLGHSALLRRLVTSAVTLDLRSGIPPAIRLKIGLLEEASCSCSNSPVTPSSANARFFNSFETSSYSVISYH